jgi:3',5'-cyclic AMP phosphodiesterase CpdA
LRIVHVSDIHFWRYAYNPLRLLSKRLLGMTSLALGRARRFRLERVPELVERVRRLEPDHILITGDLTTTALPAEFHAAKVALAGWLVDPTRVTVVPGNHDRYTMRAHRSRRFEHYFGEFTGGRSFPWIRMLDHETAILGLDPTRPGISARGKLPETELSQADRILHDIPGIRRLVVACHYPVVAPAQYHEEFARKPLVDAESVGRWLATIGPHLYCCGHVHAAWAYRPEGIPNQLSLNAGAPLLRDRRGGRSPGFLEINLEERDVAVVHHAWTGASWEPRQLAREFDFFGAESKGV